MNEREEMSAHEECLKKECSKKQRNINMRLSERERERNGMNKKSYTHTHVHKSKVVFTAAYSHMVANNVTITATKTAKVCNHWLLYDLF